MGSATELEYIEYSLRQWILNQSMKLSPNAGITIIMYHIFLTYTWHILHGFWSLVSFVWKENEQSTVCQQHKQWSVTINQEDEW